MLGQYLSIVLSRWVKTLLHCCCSVSLLANTYYCQPTNIYRTSQLLDNNLQLLYLGYGDTVTHCLGNEVGTTVENSFAVQIKRDSAVETARILNHNHLLSKCTVGLHLVVLGKISAIGSSSSSFFIS